MVAGRGGNIGEREGRLKSRKCAQEELNEPHDGTEHPLWSYRRGKKKEVPRGDARKRKEMIAAHSRAGRGSSDLK